MGQYAGVGMRRGPAPEVGAVGAVRVHVAVVGRDDQLVARLAVEVREDRARRPRAREDPRLALDQIGIVVDEDLLLVLAAQPVGEPAVRGDDDADAHREALLVGAAGRRVDGRAGCVVGQRGRDRREVDRRQQTFLGRVQSGLARREVPRVDVGIQRRLEPGGPLDPVVVRVGARRVDAPVHAVLARGGQRRRTSAVR